MSIVSKGVYKIGDKIRIIGNKTGLATEYTGKEYIVCDIRHGGDTAPYLGFKHSNGSTVYVYLEDIEHSKPPVDLSNFKGFVKSKMAANVAAV